MMKCERAIEKYLDTDNNSGIPIMLRLHIISCTKCRREIKTLRSTFMQIRMEPPYKSHIDITRSVMNIIEAESITDGKTISGFKWVSIGTIIFSSIVLINFSDSFIWLKKEFGSNYTIPLSIVMGLIFTAYAAILIACNYEYIKKYIELHSRWKLK